MITFHSGSRVFRLDTGTTSYAFFVNAYGYLSHLYYGARVPDEEGLAALARTVSGRPSFQPNPPGVPNGAYSPDVDLQEFSGFNTGDFRPGSAAVRWADGSRAADAKYVSHRVLPGVPALEDLPCARAGDDPGVETLEVVLRDSTGGAEFTLRYTVFPECDVIVRSVSVRNTGDAPFAVARLMSAQLDLRRGATDLVQLPGAWARERFAERLPLGHGTHSLRSVRGATGHNMNNAFALVDPSTTETLGDAYGFALCYSGNFRAEIDTDSFGTVRVLTGINPETFSWPLAPGETFEAPQAFLTFSPEGLGGMSRRFHDFLRRHLIDPAWAPRTRPVLINNWEATYFNFNTEKILSLAETAAKNGIEMLVLDDGWFGHRDNDRSSLGDWTEYPSKIGDMAALSKGIHDLGLKFGLWFEPEMISEDSDLYREHPDWVLSIPGRGRSLGRTQMVLDFSRPEVVDTMAERIGLLLRRARVDYMKYDMNRNHTEAYGTALPPERQGEAAHRFILGVYRFHKKLLASVPGLYIEGCSGGGGRFDCGMLAYTPAIWTSDDSDAVERCRVQLGTSLFYPCSTMGAHVSACPNHQTGRNTPFATRAAVALFGTFGYELDLSRLPAEDLAAVPKQVALFHKFNPLVTNGDLYRLTPSWTDNEIDAWMHVAKDKSRALVTVVRRRTHANPKDYFLRLAGLDPAARYAVDDGDVFSGALLMGAGFVPKTGLGDGDSALFELKRI